MYVIGVTAAVGASTVDDGEGGIKQESLSSSTYLSLCHGPAARK